MRRGMAAWLHVIKSTGCVRDQISFEFAMWKHKVRYTHLPLEEHPFIQRRVHAKKRNNTCSDPPRVHFELD